MLLRTVYIKLDADHATDEGRRVVATSARDVLGGLPQVRAVQVALPADARSLRSWDVAIHLRFDALDDVQDYVVHPDHRAWVDGFLAERGAFVKAWTFEVLDGD